MTTGQLIRAARKKKKMTQAELAEKLKISYVGVSQWENGIRNPKYDTIRKIADALDVDWTDLVPADEQCEIITKNIVEKAGLTVKDENGNIIHQGDSKPWERVFMDDETNAQRERIDYLYKRLNTDGQLAAGRYFLSRMKPDDMKEVADYIEQLADTPQYQRPEEPDEG